MKHYASSKRTVDQVTVKLPIFYDTRRLSTTFYLYKNASMFATLNWMNSDYTYTLFFLEPFKTLQITY